MNPWTEGAVSTSFDQVFGRRVNNASGVRELHNKVADDSDVKAIKNRDFLHHFLLKIDAIYIMFENLNIADGLVNGATGRPCHIDYGTNSNDPNNRRPVRIWIAFDNAQSDKATRETQECIRSMKNYPNNWAMIEKSTVQLVQNRTNNLQLCRTQFSVIPAEAITVHES